MRVLRAILTTYFLLVFLSSTCAKNRARFKSKKNTWRLKLLRKILQQSPGVELLSLRNKHNTHIPNISSGSLSGKDSNGKHVPVIQCDETSAVDLIACPSPNNKGQLFCISEEFLCDKKMDCPNGEDEELVSCMFHQWANTFFNSISKSLTDIKTSVYNLKQSLENAQNYQKGIYTYR
uniref:Uncharacterized protein LOC111105399 n=1 Tax=Crassostrea virginica TaxID=6565 RepID=A0A8B8AYJ5_CRAVI|nr:uncharacterized protein LOC111105399 [Crassostrea virginica]